MCLAHEEGSSVSIIKGGWGLQVESRWGTDGWRPGPSSRAQLSLSDSAFLLRPPVLATFPPCACPASFQAISPHGLALDDHPAVMLLGDEDLGEEAKGEVLG